MNRKTKFAMVVMGVVLVAGIVTGSSFYLKHRKFLEYKADRTPLPSGFTYTAHTGCVDTADNSLQSIEKGAEYGAEIVEFDLNFTRDNVPVLSHDEPKGDEVTLEEAFKKLSEYEMLRANVDVKNTANLGEVQTLAEKYGILDRIFYTGIELEDVETVKRDSPKVRYFLNVGIDEKKSEDAEYIATLVKTVSDCGAIGINFNKDCATEEIVTAFHEKGLLVSIWTADKEYDIYRVLSFAPDNITTRRPDRMKEILDVRNGGE